MKDYLKHYQVKIHALSPIHIGSGDTIGKKEYIYNPRDHKVIIPDVQKMYADICRRGKEQQFIQYMEDISPKSLFLSQWMMENGFGWKDYARWTKYTMDAGEAFVTAKGPNRTRPPKEIVTFVKDAYGMPYVPGSSIKGMFRTALLAWEIKNHSERYEEHKNLIKKNAPIRRNRNMYLTNETKQVERQGFYKKIYDEKNQKSAVNDSLRGLCVSDSRPLLTEQLTLSQKIDYTLDGKEKPLPVLREALVPGTEICFEVSIDTEVCAYTIDDIMDALDCFGKICYENFYKRFHRGSHQEGIVWLGGGCGFLSKTIVHSLFEEDAVEVVNHIFKNTLSDKIYKEHHHDKDIGLNLSPHVCKCTKYQGSLYDMGMGRIEIV